MPKTKQDDSSRKPYIENYPILKAWLEKHEARCQTQHMTEGYSIETWLFGNMIVVILVYANRHGWEIFTPCRSLSADETLADADARIARPTTAANKPECAVADAWIGMQAAKIIRGGRAPRDQVSPNLLDALDELEIATRNDPSRKIKP